MKGSSSKTDKNSRHEENILIDKDVKHLIRKYSLQNAIHYGGPANAGAVIGKVLAERPDLKSNIIELVKFIKIIIEEINELSLSKQKELFSEYWSEDTVIKSKQDQKMLPPLPNVEKYPFVHVRFCPNPDGALHLGGARAAILDDEYAKMYAGKLTLRFDDTDPRIKSPIPEAYDWILKDLEWLGVEWHDTVYQSNRFELYYKYAKQLIEMGGAYICTCKTSLFRGLILKNKPCVCRTLPAGEHLKRWNQMLEGHFKQGDAVVRLKTDLNHPNPAVREWPALRIIDTDKFPHPLTGNKYRVWPLFAFCCSIDDHELKISHVIRGKEHLTNSVRQNYLLNYFNWDPPEAIHYGRFKIVGGILSKSKIKEAISRGIYRGWDDPRLGTLMALRKRGFLPETIRQVILDTGIKPVDAKISWENIQAKNRKLLDSIANRYFFIANPIQLTVKNVGRSYLLHLPLHARDLDRGSRIFKVVTIDDSAHLLISKNDLKIIKSEQTIRLMGLFNITINNIAKGVESVFYSKAYTEARRIKAPMIHWLPQGTGIEASIIMPDMSIINGLAEDSCRLLPEGDIFQFERFGFVRLDSIKENKIIAYYAHR